MDNISITKFKVYGLKARESSEIRYIGITSKSLEKRLKQHLQSINYKKDKSYKKNWFNNLIKNNIKLEIELLEDNIEENEIFEKEKQYIKLFKSFGAKLVNGTEGGEMGIPTKETRRKMSIAKIGKPSNAKGRKVSNEQKELLAKLRLGSISTRRRAVLQLDLNNNIIKEFSGLTIAEKETKINNIHRCINGGRKTAGGFKWKYK